MIFTIQQVNHFIQNSGDTNPLHADDHVAELAGFEQRVVPGMLTVQYCVHPTIPPKTIQARFNEPLYPDVQYRTGLDMTKDHFWLGDPNPRFSIWLDRPVKAAHWVPSDEEHVGDYRLKDVTPEKSLVYYWISWFVGTILPGHGAILTNVEIEFMRTDNHNMEHLSYAVRIAAQKMGMVVLEAVLKPEGTVPVAYCEIRAMEARK